MTFGFLKMINSILSKGHKIEWIEWKLDRKNSSHTTDYAHIGHPFKFESKLIFNDGGNWLENKNVIYYQNPNLFIFFFFYHHHHHNPTHSISCSSYKFNSIQNRIVCLRALCTNIQSKSINKHVIKMTF